MENALGKAVESRWSQGYSSRATWNSLWRSCTRYALPNEEHFQETTVSGRERTRYILDSTAPRSLEMFGSVMHSLLNNPSTRWINIGVSGMNQTNIPPLEKAWFEEVENRMMSALSSRQADIYAQLHQVYLDLGCVGTSVLYVDMLGPDLRVRRYHMDDCVPEEGESELIDAMFRRRRYTRRQALAKWPDAGLEEKCPKFSGRPKTGDDSEWMKQKVDFIHFVVPRTDSIIQQMSPQFQKVANLAQFSHVGGWVVKDDKVSFQEMGYHEFPYIAPRWYKAHREIYGRSPTMTAMPDIRMVNRMSDTILRGAEKIVDPPLAVRDGGLVSPVRLSPGGITYLDGDAELKPLIPPGTSRIETGNQLLEQRQNAIREAYFVPLFITPDSPVKTATQVMQEVDERNRALAPMLVRIQSELFHLLINRVYGLMSRAGMLPPMPATLAADVALGRRTVKLEYNSPLVASQRQLDGLALTRLFQAAAQWGSVNPAIFDNFDIDEVARILHDASGTPAAAWNSTNNRDKLRNDRQAQQQAQQQAGIVAQGGDVAAKLLAAQKPNG